MERGLHEGRIRLASDPHHGLASLLGWAGTMRGPASALADCDTTKPIARANGHGAPGPAASTAPRSTAEPIAVADGDGAPGSPAAPRRVQLPSQSRWPAASALAPGSAGLAMKLDPAPLEPADLRFPINLATALRLSDARPLIVAAAQASVWVAEAQLTRAKVLWVPTFVFGADYIRHDGGGPDFNKGVLTAPSVNFFYGGAAADLYVNVTDAIFEPLVARQVLNSRQADIQTAKNDALLLTAEAYFKVHQYRGMYAAVLYCVERGHDLVARIAQLSRELVPPIEVDRARNMVADLEQRATSAREAWRVQSTT